MSNIRAYSLFEIGKNRNYRPIYTYRFDQSVRAGTPVQDVLSAAMRLQASGEAARARQNGSRAPWRPRGRPDRYLDVDERRRLESCLYVFYLNRDNRLRFADNSEPFMYLPLNDTTPEPFIKIEYRAADGLSAAFTCDLDRVRGSGLAKRIKDRAEPHNYRLNIPFYFNVFDPYIEAAPWVLTDHTGFSHSHSGHSHSGHSHSGHEHPGHEHSGHSHSGHEHSGHEHPGHEQPRSTHTGSIFTHGGVHPVPVALLSVEL